MAHRAWSSFGDGAPVLQLASARRGWRGDRLGDALGQDGLSRGGPVARAASWFWPCRHALLAAVSFIFFLPGRSSPTSRATSARGKSGQTGTGASLSDRAALSRDGYSGTADRRGKGVCRRAWQRGLSDGGRESQSCDWRRAAWHWSATMAWTGARHVQGRRLLLDWRRWLSNNRPVRISH